MLLLGDLGQQLDIDDIEADVVRLRARIKEQQTTDRSQEEALVALRREITDLKLMVGGTHCTPLARFTRWVLATP